MNTRHFPKKVSVIIVLLILMTFIATPALAFSSRNGDTLVIARGEVVDDDLYTAANTIRVEGTIKGDLVAFGSLVVIGESGVVEGDLLGAAQGLVVDGTVQDDIRVAGMTIKLGKTAQVGGDLLAAGYSVEAVNGSQVGKDVVAVGNVVDLSGAVARNVQVSAGGLQIGGKVGGDVTADVGVAEDVQQGFSPQMFMPTVAGMPTVATIPGGLTLGSGAQVAGKLNYTAVKQTTLPASSVAGGITYNPQPTPTPEEAKKSPKPVTPANQAMDWGLKLLRNLATLLLVGLLLSYFAPELVKAGAQVIRSRPLPSFGWGILMYASFFFALFALFILVIILAVILGIVTLGDLLGTVIGAGIVSFSALILGFNVAASYISKILVGYLIGVLLFNWLKPELAEHRLWPALVGIVIYVILVAIPVLGTVVNILAVLVGLGALYLAFRQWFKARKEAAIPAG